MPDKEVYHYGDTGVSDYPNNPIPLWLRISYYLLIPIGIFMMWYFWNGARGWFDRGHWHALEQAANTTAPLEQQTEPNPALDSPYITPLPE